MKVKKWGKVYDRAYEAICRDLGDYIAEIHFIEVDSDGSIGFSCGKPDEIRRLYSNCKSKGYVPSFRISFA